MPLSENNIPDEIEAKSLYERITLAVSLKKVISELIH